MKIIGRCKTIPPHKLNSAKTEFSTAIHMRNAGFDVTHLRIVRPNFNSPLTVEQQQHPSETALDSYHADYVICNDGTISDLKRKLSNWLGGEQH